MLTSNMLPTTCGLIYDCLPSLAYSSITCSLKSRFVCIESVFIMNHVVNNMEGGFEINDTLLCHCGKWLNDSFILTHFVGLLWLWLLFSCVMLSFGLPKSNRGVQSLNCCVHGTYSVRNVTIVNHNRILGLKCVLQLLLCRDGLPRDIDCIRTRGLKELVS